MRWADSCVALSRTRDVRIVAGCDGGGTKCVVRVAILDGGAIVGQGIGYAGSANVATNCERAIENIRAATLDALRSAAAGDLASIEQMVAAVAGASKFASGEELQTRLVHAIPLQRVSIVPDVSILFAAAELTGPAVATV